MAKKKKSGGGDSASIGSIVVLVVWFASSVLFNYVTPHVSKVLDTNDVTIVELAIGILCGVLGLKFSGGGAHVLPKSLLHFLSMFPYGIIHYVGCRAFVVAIQNIPLSLVQSIRASNPVVVVFISLVFLKQSFSLKIYSAIALICAGFGLAVGGNESDSSTSLTGVVAALTSILCVVVVRLCVKYEISKSKKKAKSSSPSSTQSESESDSNGANKAKANGKTKKRKHAEVTATAVEEEAPPNDRQMLLWISMIGLLISLPFWTYYGGVPRLSNTLQKNTSALSLIALDGFMYFVEQSAEYSCVRRFSPLTLSVIDTIRRFTIVVVSGFILHSNPWNATNVLGGVLIASGAIYYNRVKSAYEQQVAKHKKAKLK